MSGPEGPQPVEVADPPAFVPLHEPPLWERVHERIREVAAQSSWRERIAFDRRAVYTAVVTVVVVLIVGLAVLRSAPGAGPPAEVTLPTAPRSVASASAAGVSAAPPEAVVHITGAVQRPGVYRLPAEARVGEAIEAAGGASTDADIESVNLAALVADGERIYVPRRGEQVPSTAAADSGGPTPAVVNVNSASAGDLDALPGVGPSLAGAIVEYRTQHGRFATVDALLDVPGIGPAKLASLRSRVRV